MDAQTIHLLLRVTARISFLLIWTIFAFGFVGGAMRSAFYLPFAAAVMAALGLRLFAASQARKTAALPMASH